MKKYQIVNKKSLTSPLNNNHKNTNKKMMKRIILMINNQNLMKIIVSNQL